MDREGRSPILKEIAELLDISSPAASRLLGSLERKGYIWAGKSAHMPFGVVLRDDEPFVPPTAILGGLFPAGRVEWLKRNRLSLVFLLEGSNPHQSFFLQVKGQIPELSIANRDLVLFDRNHDICLDDLVLVEFEKPLVVAYKGRRLRGYADEDFVDTSPISLQEVQAVEKTEAEEIVWQPLTAGAGLRGLASRTAKQVAQPIAVAVLVLRYPLSGTTPETTQGLSQHR